MKTAVIKLDSRRPDPDHIYHIADSLREGKIVAFPTETVYGLGVLPACAGAVDRLRQLKKRTDSKAFAYHIGRWDMISELAVIPSRVFKFLSREFLPGPVTLIALNRQEQKVGIRFPKHEIACQLINACGEPVVATSANASGEPSAVTAQEVLKTFPTGVDLVIDGGRSALSQDSTVIDTTATPPKILREGAQANEVRRAIERIQSGKFLRKHILIICTGNTCRSPMAETWLHSELKRKGLADEISVSSCGTAARDGREATVEAMLTLKNDDLSFEKFKTHRFEPYDAVTADLILAMTEEHKRFIEKVCPAASGKISVLDVEDPVGLSIDVYQRVYEAIKTKISDLWPEIVK